MDSATGIVPRWTVSSPSCGRACFRLLHEAFDYPFAELGAVLGKSAPSCRQLLHGARERIAAGQARFAASAGAQTALVEQFLGAASRDDLAR